MTKRKTLLYFVARATMTLLVMLLTTATALADTGFNYIGADGSVRNTWTNDGIPDDGVIVINEDKPSYGPGWYIVEGTVSYSEALCLSGDVHLILADNAQLIINSNDTGIYTETSCNLFVYAQSTGNNQGMISATGGDSPGILVTNIDIYGGIINIYDSGCGIKTKSNGSVNIYGGTVNASGNDGIITGSITITGGSVTAIGTIYYGINANYGNGSITLNGGIVTASSYNGKVTIDEGCTYTDGTIDYNTGILTDDQLTAINNAKTVWPKVDISYIDENGDEKTCSEYIMLTNGTDISSALGTSDNETWYVVQGNVNYNSTLEFNGETHLILADGANFTINNGLAANDGLTIYGQGDNTGILNSASYGYGISVSGYFTINGGTINASSPNNSGISASSVTINGGTVTATGDDYGISTGGEIIINGGFIEAIGDYYGIYSSDGSITITGGTVTTTGGISTDSSSDITITGGKVTANGKEDGISSSGGNIIISGGDITAISTGNNGDRGGIWTFGGDIEITDGNVTATATGDYGNGLFSGANKIYDVYCGGTITISGGTVIANGNKSGIYAKIDDSNVGTITLSGGSVTAKASDENIANSYRGNVIIADYLIYSDGTNTYEGLLTLDNNQKAAIAGKGMHPVKESYPLTASLVDGNYWTTFYCSDGGYSITSSDAYAYTATYGLKEESTTEYELTLNKLGTDIPQGTAVIIVSSTASVSLTKNDDLGTFGGSNSLRGVDVRTDMLTLGSGTFYVMGKKGDDFGFFKYTGEYMPAHKAYLRINSSNEALARGITMVFENSTGIKSIDKAQIGTEPDAWYSLDGRKLLVKPTTKGVYINNGNKVVIK